MPAGLTCLTPDPLRFESVLHTLRTPGTLPGTNVPPALQDYNELVNISTQQTTEMLDKLEQTARELQKAKNELAQAKLDHQETQEDFNGKRIKSRQPLHSDDDRVSPADSVVSTGPLSQTVCHR